MRQPKRTMPPRSTLKRPVRLGGLSIALIALLTSPLLLNKESTGEVMLSERAREASETHEADEVNQAPVLFPSRPLDMKRSSALLDLPWVGPLDEAPALLQAERVRAAEQGADPLPAPEGWSTREAWLTWRSLARDVERAWSIAERGEVDERWFEQMGVEGPRPRSHTWPGGSDGFLLNAPRLKDSPLWDTRRYKNYATPEAIMAIKGGVYALHLAYPDSPRTIIGDLSKRYGGHFPPHLSHQSGRDADIGYFVRGPLGRRLKGLMMTTPRQLDVGRTWAFVHGMIKTGLVEQVYIDYRLQRRLYRHAKRLGHSQEELKTWFSYPYARGGLIWHLKGHADHLHVRFKAPSSEASGAALVREEGRRSLRPRPRYGRVKPQDTLRAIAKRYRVPLKALSRWNRLTPNPKLKPKRSRLVVGFHTPWHIAKRARMFSKAKAEGSAEGS